MYVCMYVCMYVGDTDTSCAEGDKRETYGFREIQGEIRRGGVDSAEMKTSAAEQGQKVMI